MNRRNVISNQTQNRRRQSDGERRSFSKTAGATLANNVGSGQPKRGGIRL